MMVTIQDKRIDLMVQGGHPPLITMLEDGTVLVRGQHVDDNEKIYHAFLQWLRSYNGGESLTQGERALCCHLLERWGEESGDDPVDLYRFGWSPQQCKTLDRALNGEQTTTPNIQTTRQLCRHLAEKIA